MKFKNLADIRCEYSHRRVYSLRSVCRDLRLLAKSGSLTSWMADRHSREYLISDGM